MSQSGDVKEINAELSANDAGLNGGAILMEGHTDMISGVHISRDGSRFVSGSWDHSVKIWNGKANTCELTRDEHAGELTLNEGF